MFMTLHTVLSLLLGLLPKRLLSSLDAWSYRIARRRAARRQRGA